MAGASGLIAPTPGKRQLWVEGPDDKGVMIAILNHIGAPDRLVDVRPVGGIDETLARLRIELAVGSGLSRLGVIVDADSDVQRCWDRIRPILMGATYSSIPPKPEPGGLILIQAGLPAVGVWIMPDNLTSGAVEEFAQRLIPATDKLWPLAENVIQQVIATDKRFADTHEMKATIHTWLAWQEEPGRPMGQAITKRFLNPSSSNASVLYDWLRELYGL